MRYLTVVFWLLFCSVTSAIAQVSISIGINLPMYPTLVQVPNYPVYYAPRLNSNFFFYDGMYWVYAGDNWYSSSWYNGPWWFVGPEYVPLFVLRIPVRYYRDPPMYFRGWQSDAPPRWGHHWGNEWEQRRSGWDRWQRSSVPAPAPLPVYQRQYSGDRYPRVEQQHELNSRNYSYQPRDAVVRQHYQEQAVREKPATSQQAAPQERTQRQQDFQRANPPASEQQGSQVVPRSQSPQRSDDDGKRSAPMQASPRQRDPGVDDQKQQPQAVAVPREQKAPRPDQESMPRGKGASQESRQEQENASEKERELREERREERRQERNR